MSELDELVEAAREAEPAPVSETERERAIRRAAVGGAARHRAWVRRRVLAVAGVAGALAAAAVTLLALPPAPPTAPTAEAPSEPASSEPSDLELPTGDRILTSAGARYSVRHATVEDRRVRLTSGAMLCDVQPVADGRFRVRTPHTEIVVLGTVFTVHTGEAGTTVHVYEGRVRATTPEGSRLVTAGGVLHVGEGPPAADSLVGPAREAARARAELAASEPSRPEAPDETEPPDTPAPTDRPPRRPGPDEVRRWIADGDAPRALALAESALESGRLDPWSMLRADALRALGRHAEAAEAYGRAARALDPPRRQQAGWLEARLRATRLDDPAGALDALETAAVIAEGSPLRERALVFETELHRALGRTAARVATARTYLRLYPDGTDADAMRRIVEHR